MKNNNFLKKLGTYLFENKVMIAFAIVCIGAIIVSKSPMSFIVDGVITRIGRNTFTVLALIIPVVAGLGLNFGIVIGAIAAQIAVFWSVYWGFQGIQGMLICLLMATPLAILFGFLVGKLFNKMKGAEMIAGLILGFFADGLYQLLFLVIIGGVIPVDNPTIIISGGVGVKNTIDLTNNLKYAIDSVRMVDMITILFYAMLIITAVKAVLHLLKKYTFKKPDAINFGIIAVIFALSYIPVIERWLFADRLVLLQVLTIALIIIGLLQVYKIVKEKLINKNANFLLAKPIFTIILCGVIYGLTYIPKVEDVLLTVKIPLLPFILIALLCLFNQKILDTRFGQNMRTVGQSQSVAMASGINVDRTRVLAMIISTVLARGPVILRVRAYANPIPIIAPMMVTIIMVAFAVSALRSFSALISSAAILSPVIMP